MLNRILEVIGIALMFFGMCMEDCGTVAFLFQIGFIIAGSLLFFVGASGDKMDDEDERIDESIRRMRDAG